MLCPGVHQQPGAGSKQPAALLRAASTTLCCKDWGAAEGSLLKAQGWMSSDPSQLLVFPANQWPMTPELVIKGGCPGVAHGELIANPHCWLKGRWRAGCGSLVGGMLLSLSSFSLTLAVPACPEGCSPPSSRELPPNRTLLLRRCCGSGSLWGHRDVLSCS